MLVDKKTKTKKMGKKRRPIRPEEKEFLHVLGMDIRKRRSEKNFTQEDLSQHSGVSKISITNIERGITGTTLKTLMKLASALDTTAQEMLSIAGNAALEYKKREINKI